MTLVYFGEMLWTKVPVFANLPRMCFAQRSVACSASAIGMVTKKAADGRTYNLFAVQPDVSRTWLWELCPAHVNDANGSSVHGHAQPALVPLSFNAALTAFSR